MAILASLAKLIRMALRWVHFGRMAILASHVFLDEVQKDDYHTKRLGRLPKTMAWAPESLREESCHRFGGLKENGRIRLGHPNWNRMTHEAPHSFSRSFLTCMQPHVFSRIFLASMYTPNLLVLILGCALILIKVNNNNYGSISWVHVIFLLPLLSLSI